MMMRSPRVASVNSTSCPSRGSAKAKNGPTVCDGVWPDIESVLHWRGFAPAQHNIEAKSERPFRHGRLHIEARDHSCRGILVWHTVKDWIERTQRIAGKIHWRHQPRQEARAE